MLIRLTSCAEQKVLCRLALRLNLAIEADEAYPHSIIAVLPNQFATEHPGDGFRPKIVVKSKKALVECLATRTKGEDSRRWVVLGREDQGRGKSVGLARCNLD